MAYAISLWVLRALCVSALGVGVNWV
jgi:hypothetical protein